VKIQLVYFPGCPHIDAARTALHRELRALDLFVAIEEIDITAPSIPAELRHWGSPTILIEGQDVEGAAPGEDVASCRLYAGETRGAPAGAAIRAALERARR
jgi:hypothetical protein